MADSNITKQAMAAAFKELLREHSFDKISVSDICERCHMNRKSFYYHFKDKFDLANWIFDTEFLELAQQQELEVCGDSIDERWEGLEAACRYFYNNRVFYGRLLRVEGQNSFTEHFQNFLHPVIRARVADLIDNGEIPDMVYYFLVDGICGAFDRWLLEKDCMPPEDFMHTLKELLKLFYLGFTKRISDDPGWLNWIQS